MFLSGNKNNNVYPCKPQFYFIEVGFKGVKIILACFRDVKFYRLSGATFYDCIDTIYRFIKHFLDNKMYISEEYGAFRYQIKHSHLLYVLLPSSGGVSCSICAILFVFL